MITRRVLVYEFASGGGFGAAAAPLAILAEGRAMRDAVCMDLAQLRGIELCAACADATPPPAGRAVVAERGEAAADFLRRTAATVDAVWLIAPESQGIALALTRLLEDSGCAIIGCASAAVAPASSKTRTLACLAAAGIATVPTWPLATAPLTSRETWVIKPDVGCGCEAMRRVSAAEARRMRAGSAADVIAQPWIEGQAMSLSLLVAGAAVELLSVNRQHIGVAADGTLSLAGISRNMDVDAATRRSLEAMARGVAAALPGLAGFVGIDFMFDADRRIPVLEVNPRLTSAYVGLSARLGRRLAAEILRAGAPALFAHV
jgi:predicted ATP-grasp superfamily ATP-dependent carboligase